MAIYIHDEAAQLRLRVTNDLDEQAANELASCWKTASSVVGERRIVMDLTGLSSIQETGRQLLELMGRKTHEVVSATYPEGLSKSICGNGALRVFSYEDTR